MDLDKLLNKLRIIHRNLSLNKAEYSTFGVIYCKHQDFILYRLEMLLYDSDYLNIIIEPILNKQKNSEVLLNILFQPIDNILNTDALSLDWLKDIYHIIYDECKYSVGYPINLFNYRSEKQSFEINTNDIFTIDDLSENSLTIQFKLFDIRKEIINEYIHKIKKLSYTERKCYVKLLYGLNILINNYKYMNFIVDKLKISDNKYLDVIFTHDCWYVNILTRYYNDLYCSWINYIYRTIYTILDKIELFILGSEFNNIHPLTDSFIKDNRGLSVDISSINSAYNISFLKMKCVSIINTRNKNKYDKIILGKLLKYIFCDDIVDYILQFTFSKYI